MRPALKRTILAACVLASATLAAAAEDYPVRPIRVITNTSAGGLSDIFARAVGEQVRQDWGQTFVVDNRPGGSQNVGANACAQASNDGYTICILNAEVRDRLQRVTCSSTCHSIPDKDLVPGHQSLPPAADAGDQLVRSRPGPSMS